MSRDTIDVLSSAEERERERYNRHTKITRSASLQSTLDLFFCPLRLGSLFFRAGTIRRLMETVAKGAWKHYLRFYCDIETERGAIGTRKGIGGRWSCNRLCATAECGSSGLTC